MNKLTIEEKKIIAEKVYGCSLGAYGIIWNCSKQMPRYIEDYNPDQDTPEGLSQFVAMIGALDVATREQVNMNLLCLNDSYSITSFGLDNFNWLCSHKYEVCMAIKEVVG